MNDQARASTPAEVLTVEQLGNIHAFIDAARQAALLPELERRSSAIVRTDVDHLEAGLPESEPDLAALRAVAARIHALIVADEQTWKVLALPLHYALEKFP